LAIFLGFRIHGAVASHAALRDFAYNPGRATQSGTERALPEPRDADSRLWSAKRIEAYKQSRAAASDAPIAVLAIPRISLEVPVFEGTDELTLNRGAGRIAGTAEPGQGGNIGIAGQRDSDYGRAEEGATLLAVPVF
jgi:sortase A